MNFLLAPLKNSIFIQRQFFTFILVGMINTIFGYSIFTLFIYLHFHYSIAMLVATCLGILFNFQTTGVIVFKNQNKKLILQFIAVYATMYFLSLTLLNIIRWMGISNLYISGAIVTCITPLISFTLNKFYVFTGSNRVSTKET